MPIPRPRCGVQSSVEDVVTDGGDDFPAPRPTRLHARSVIEERTGYERLAQVIVHRSRNHNRDLPRRAILRRKRTKLRPGEIRYIAMTPRIPAHFVNDLADGVR